MNTTHNQSNPQSTLIELDEVALADINGGENTIEINGHGYCADVGCASVVYWSEGSDGGP